MSVAEIGFNDLNTIFGSAAAYDRSALIDRVRVWNEPLCTHAELVARAVECIADRLDLAEDDRVVLVDAAWLHDIGKLTISRKILDKPTALDPSEWSEMQQHAARGAAYLALMPPSGRVAELVRHHHERFDGGGYPNGLAGDAIPRGSRIICVVDAYDAMTSDRPYRRAMPPEAAVDEVRRCAGTQFDPEIVTAFISIVPLMQKGSAA